MVVKHVHHTTDLEDIRNELRALGHEVRNVMNVRHGQAKEPPNIFLVELEPAKNNEDIYEVKAIQNKIIQIEPLGLPNHPYHNACAVSNMGTRANIVTNLTSVSNAEDITTVQSVLNPWHPSKMWPMWRGIPRKLQSV